MSALGLVLHPDQWRRLEWEAQSRGLTPEALFAARVEAWMASAAIMQGPPPTDEGPVEVRVELSASSAVQLDSHPDLDRHQFAAAVEEQVAWSEQPVRPSVRDIAGLHVIEWQAQATLEPVTTDGWRVAYIHLAVRAQKALKVLEAVAAHLIDERTRKPKTVWARALRPLRKGEAVTNEDVEVLDDHGFLAEDDALDVLIRDVGRAADSLRHWDGDASRWEER